MPRVFWHADSGCHHPFSLVFCPAEKLDAVEIQRLGLLAVKIGQMYALRPDLLGECRTRELQSLYEDTEPLPWARVEELLKVHTVPGFFEHFEEIEREPLASASLGQVHGGRLKAGGRWW